MKTGIKFLFLAAIALLTSALSSAQCVRLSPGYTVMYTFSTPSLTPTTLDQPFTQTLSATLEGTTTVTGTNCYAYHAPSLNLIFGTYEHTATQGQVPMTNYISLSNVATTSLTAGQSITEVIQGWVYCTHLAANIFYFRLSDYYQFAYVWTKATGPSVPALIPPNTWNYPVAQMCTNGTPDYNPISANDSISPYDTYFIEGAFMSRTSTGVKWSVIPTPIPPFTIWSFPATPPIAPEHCTHTGPQA